MKQTLNLLFNIEKWLSTNPAAKNVANNNNSTILICCQYGINSGNDMEWKFCYHLNECLLWPLTPGWAFHSSQAENKEQRHLAFWLSFFFFPPAGSQCRDLFVYYKANRVPRFSPSWSKTSLSCMERAGSGKHESLLLYVTLVGFGLALVWLPLSMLLFCPWTREVEFTEAALIVPIQRVSDTNGYWKQHWLTRRNGKIDGGN